MTTPTHIPFTLELWQSGLYDVVTRDRGIVTDLYLRPDGQLYSAIYATCWNRNNGHFVKLDTRLDLFLVPKDTTHDEGSVEPNRYESADLDQCDPPCALCSKEKREHWSLYEFYFCNKIIGQLDQYTPKPQPRKEGDACAAELRSAVETSPPKVPSSGGETKLDFVHLLNEAENRVKTSELFKRFIAGTPLENDIAVWMVEFAVKHTEQLSAAHDKLVERSVGAMSIAEGDEGHEEIPRDCPMLEAVSSLHTRLDQVTRERDAALRAYEIVEPLVDWNKYSKPHSLEQALEVLKEQSK